MFDRCTLLLKFSFALVTTVHGAAEDRPATESVRFNRDIRPILSDNCFKCHGPDKTARQAELRLDTRDGAFAQHGDTRPVVAGKPEDSALFRRITSTDPDEKMPPADAGKSLTPVQVDTLRRWIEQGADWEEHWSFNPPVRSAVPNVARPQWPRNAIDHFIFAGLERRNLAPSPEAPPHTLARRVTLDLTGLPPTPAEVDAFVNDPAPDRYERLVERLLASPRYGEHLATDWLDAARFADSSGYQNDGPRFMWRWRDWVIDACNAGMPFDQFTIEQLAGDLLPDPTLAQRIATGFNRNHRGNSEGGIIPEEYSVEYVVDRVDTTGAVWLGLTIGCARCHEHKFDPISQEEYYRLFAYFNSVPEYGRAIKEGNSPPYIAAQTEDQEAELAALRRELRTAEAEWERIAPQADAAQREWERTDAAQAPTDWTITAGLLARFPLDGDLMDQVQSDRRAQAATGDPEYCPGPRAQAIHLDGTTFLDAGTIEKFGYLNSFTVSAWINPAGNLTGGIVSRMTDDSDSDGWALHLENGHIQVNLVKRWLDDSLRVETESSVAPDQWQHVLMTYDGSRVARGIAIYINGVSQPIRVSLDGLNQTFLNDQPLRIGSTGTLKRMTGSVADVRVYDRALSSREVQIVGVGDPVTELAAIPPESRSPVQATKLQEFFLTQVAAGPIRQAYADLRSRQSDVKEFQQRLPTTMVMAALPQPRDTRVLQRGAYDKPGEQVVPGIPEVLGGAASRTGNTRLDLARWLVDPANPLTARVAVNRYWQRLFGTGLVKTSEDFGTQGELPSHPELLDWLATEFVRTGWDVKGMHRLIVTSATYRQSSHVTPELLTADPENRLLARGPRFRLSAEMLRDQALAVSGLLAERLGGPSVKPYQPAGLWEEIATDTLYEQSTGPDLYRRSLYTYWKRTVANPTLTLFDAPTREACVLRRGRTNTPLQALTLLNDVTFVEAARKLAERAILEAGPTSEDRIAHLFQLATGRAPRPPEMSLLASSFRSHRDTYTSDREAALALIEAGESKPHPELDPVALAAFTAVAGVVLNLDEAVTKE